MARDLFEASGLDPATPVAGADLFADTKPASSASPFRAGLRAGIGGVKATGFGARAVLTTPGSAAEAEALAASRAASEAAAQDSMQLQDLVANPTLGNAAAFAKNALGEVLPFSALMLAGGGVGGFGARALARRLLVKNATKNLLTATGALAGAFAPSFVAETGEIMPEAVEQGVENPRLRAVGGGAAAAALDVIVPGAVLGAAARRLGLFGKITDAATRKAGIGAIAKGAAKVGVLAGIGEVGTEIAQTAIERAAAGQVLTDEEAKWAYANAAAKAAVGGVTLGGVGGAVQTAAKPIEQPGRDLLQPSVQPASDLVPSVAVPPPVAEEPLPEILPVEDILEPPDTFAREVVALQTAQTPISSPYSRTASPFAEDADLARRDSLIDQRTGAAARIAELDAELTAPKKKGSRAKEEILIERNAEQARVAFANTELERVENLLKTRQVLRDTPTGLGFRTDRPQAGDVRASDVIVTQGAVGDTTEAETAVARLKRETGSLVSSREARLAPVADRRQESLQVVTERQPRERSKPVDDKTRRGAIETAAVESIKRHSAELAAAGAFRKGTAVKTKNAVIEAAVAAAEKGSIEEAQASVRAAALKYLGGVVNKQDAETFADSVAKDIAQAPTLYSKSGIDEITPGRRRIPDGTRVELERWGHRYIGVVQTSTFIPDVKGGGWFSPRVRIERSIGVASDAEKTYAPGSELIDHVGTKVGKVARLTPGDIKRVFDGPRALRSIGAVDGVPFTHWGAVPTGVLDPAKIGTGIRGADQPAAKALGLNYTSAIISGSEYTEPRVQVRTQYEGVLAKDKVYVARRADPMYEQARAELQRQFGVVDPNLVWTQYAKMARDKGFDAVQFAGGQLWIFTPQPVREAVPVSRAAALPQAATVNIGLKVETGGSITVEDALAALRATGAEVTQSATHQSDTEETLVAQLSRPLNPVEAEAVATALKQEAIAQMVGEGGELYGPKADAWRPFNPEYFLGLDGRRASDATKESVDQWDAEQRERGAALLEHIHKLVGYDPSLEIRLFAAGDGEPIGSYTPLGPVKSLITLALNAKDGLSVADHEGFHYLEDRVLTSRDKTLVERAFRPGGLLWKPLIEKARAYDRANKTNITYEIASVPAEARAYGFEFWRRGELKATGLIDRVFRALREILESISNMIRGQGFQSVEDVFSALDQARYEYRKFAQYAVADSNWVNDVEEDVIPGKRPLSRKGEGVASKAKGRPYWVQNGSDVAVMRERLRKLALEGEVARNWHAESAAAILAWAKGNVSLAARMAALISNFSPRTPVGLDLKKALTAYTQWEQKATIAPGAPREHIDGAKRILYGLEKDGSTVVPDSAGNIHPTGIKRNNFFQNLMLGIDPRNYSPGIQGSTIDMWMAHAFEFANDVSGSVSKSQYNYADAEVKRLANELGWSVEETQAAIWVATKARGNSARSLIEKHALRKGWYEQVTTRKTGTKEDLLGTSADTTKRAVRPIHEREFVTEWMRLARTNPISQEQLVKANYNYARAFEDIYSGKIDLTDRLDQLPFELVKDSDQDGYGMPQQPTLFSRGAAQPGISLTQAADQIARMPKEQRDNTELGDFPGHARAYDLYEARLLAKKPADRLVRVTDRNTFSLWSSYDYVVNVDGEHFGVTKQEDPDAPDDDSQFVYAYNKLTAPDRLVVTTTNDAAELFKEIRGSATLFSRGARAPDQTQTPEFKRWFGDSKVVDAEGKPLVVYHGTNSDFSEFRITERPWSVRGFHFAENQSATEMFSSGGGGNVMPVYLAIRNPFTGSVREYADRKGLLGDNNRSRISDALIADGYDGIRYTFGQSGPVWVAFRPEQIKSAIGNRGTFDPTNPNILYSRAATDMDRQIAHGELEREQYQRRVAELIEDANIPDLTFKQAFGALKGQFVGGLQRWRLANLATGNYISRFSSGYANVQKALLAYVKRKSTLISEGSLVGLSEWHDGASQDDITTVGRALLTRTERGLLAGSPEFSQIIEGLSDKQRRMFKQATDMIAGRLNHEFAVEQGTMRELLPQAEYAQWFANRDAQVKKLIAEGYVPERRYGDYTVHIFLPSPDGKKPLTVHYEQFQNEASAKVHAEQYREILAREAPELQVEAGYRYRAERDTTISIQQFLDTARRYGIPLEQAEKERVAKALVAADSVRRNRIFRRKNIPGYSEDAMRILHEFVVTTANKVAYTEFGPAINDAIEGRPVDARTERGVPAVTIDQTRNLWKDDGPQSGFYRNLSDELVDYVLVPDHSGNWSRNLRGAAMFYFLGGSLASGAVNAMSIPMNTIPWLSQSTEYTTAFSTTLSSWSMTLKNQAQLRDIPTLKNRDVAIPAIDAIPGLRDALIVAAEDGRTMDTEIHQIMGMSQGSLLAKSRRVQRAAEAWMFPFRFAEQTNRITTFIAGYRIGQKNGLTGRALYDFAANAVDNTQNRYDEVNRPGLARHPVWALLFMFKSFPLFTIEMLEIMYRQSPKSAVYMLAGLFVLTGVHGFPFAEPLLDLIDTVSQRIFGSPFNARRAMRNILKDASEAIVGSDQSELVLRGAINDLTGLNVASRIGLGDFVPGTRIGAAESDYGRLLEQVLGASIAMLTDVVPGVAKAVGSGLTLDGEGFAQALREGGPTAVRNLIKAGEQLDRGYSVDAKDRKLVDVTGPEVFWQALGFSSANLHAAYENDKINRQTVAFYAKVRSDFMQQLTKAVREGDTAGAQETMTAMQRWSEVNPEMPIALSPSAIRRQIIEAGLPLNERTMRSMPRQIRGTAVGVEGIENTL